MQDFRHGMHSGESGGVVHGVIGGRVCCALQLWKVQGDGVTEFCRVGLRDEDFNSPVIPAKAEIQPNQNPLQSKAELQIHIE
jgi:hypothetical protein